MRLRHGPIRTGAALAAALLTAIGATVSMPVAASADPGLADQYVTWTDVPDTPLAAGTVSVAAVASSGLPVRYTSSSTDVCTVDGDVVTLHRQGRCTIRGTQPGNASFAAAEPASTTFAVLGRAQRITWARTPDTPVTAGTVRVSATASSGLPVAYTSGTPRTCTVRGGTVTLVGGGTCTVRAGQPGDDEYAPAPHAEDSFDVARSGQAVTFTRPDDASLATRTVRVAATATSGLPVAVTSADRHVCTVRRHLVTLVGAGTCVLRADQPGNARYSPAARVVRAFAVGRGRQHITFPVPGPAAVAAGTVTIAPAANSGLPVTVAGAAPAVCTVAGGTVTLHAVGTCVLRATRPATANWTAAPDVEVRFTVGRGAQQVTFPAPPPTAAGAGTLTLAAAATSGLPVTYAAATPAVCTVAGAVVTLVRAGTCTVHADQPGDAAWEPAARATATFTVTGDAQTVTLAPVPDTRLTDGTVTLRAAATSGLPVRFSAAPRDVCTARGAVVTLRTPGRCTVTAAQPGDAGHAAAPPVRHTFTVTRGAQRITVTQPPARNVLDGPFTVAATASSYLPVVLSSGSPHVCTVAGTTVTPVAAGACIVRADQPGNDQWAPAPRAGRTVRIAPAAQTVAFPAPPAAAVSDGTVTLTATATSGLPVTYTTGGDACTVAGATVTPLAAGACVLVAHQDGDHRFAAAPDVTATLTVLRDPPPVTVPAAPPAAGGLGSTAGGATVGGAAVTVHGGGFKPGSAVQVVMYSAPQRLGTTYAAADGTFALLVVVPAGLDRGGHTLLAAGLAADNTLRLLSTPVTVSAAAAALPVTGGPVRTLAVLGAWAVLIGTVLRLLGRRGWPHRWTYRARHALT
ncbi:hypothetical protein Daura_26535 [Dactylosporangium aurantiacum]|uniref:IPT/TIG domain-containing protein n=1 Tax=Dactylosporangium aurantiacum TaxID=35754 RepID=A0A9Q9MC07_9ACTN|nr:hypothetical protein [Dactylosporangium aurantiacum]MDG6106580.1 hypothetical protein [Dactylosporangium aurantiacum]UWZ50394.1 hypothetical protein Daura_26535 [Dactylosporangium aurantiacum]